MRQDGWAELFWAAFKQSRNPMLLLDDPRLVVDANDAFLALTGDKRQDVIGRPASSLVEGGPVLSSEEWVTRLAVGHFTGDTELRCVGGDSVLVQWGAHVEIVTGRRLILLVALSMSPGGGTFGLPRLPGPRTGSCPRASVRSCDSSPRGVRVQRARTNCTSPPTPCAPTCAMP